MPTDTRHEQPAFNDLPEIDPATIKAIEERPIEASTGHKQLFEKHEGLALFIRRSVMSIDDMESRAVAERMAVDVARIIGIELTVSNSESDPDA